MIKFIVTNWKRSLNLKFDLMMVNHGENDPLDVRAGFGGGVGGFFLDPFWSLVMTTSRIRISSFS